MKRSTSIIILSMYDLLYELRVRHELSNALLRDLIELVAYCQIDSVRANGVESIFSETPAYICPMDFIDEDLRVMFSNLYPKPCYRKIKSAAAEALLELPPEESYWERVRDLKDPQFNLKWNGSDLILEVS